MSEVKYTELDEQDRFGPLKIRFNFKTWVSVWVERLSEDGIEFEYSQDYLDVLNMLAYPEVYELEELEDERLNNFRRKEAERIVREIEIDIDNKYKIMRF